MSEQTFRPVTFIFHGLSVDGLPIVFDSLFLDTRIHEEDAYGAIWRKLKKSQIPEFAAENLLVDSMAYVRRKHGKYTKRQKISATPKMFDRLKNWDTRKDIFSPVEWFILKNWRCVRLGEREYPGLWEWTSAAAFQLLSEHEYPGTLDCDERRYDKWISVLGLTKSRRNAVVSHVTRERSRDGKQLSDTIKIYFKT